jgi:NADPH2:quinone reductase
VSDIAPGDRVGYLLGPQGAYADVRLMPAEVLIPLPDGVSDRTAATLMMKGMTAQYLFRQVYPAEGWRDHPVPRRGRRRRPDRLPVGARAGRDDDRHGEHRRAKAEAARANGCAHTIVTGARDIADIPARVRELTGGKGVPVVYDSVGKDTLMASLDSLQVRGTLVSNGTSRGRW